MPISASALSNFKIVPAGLLARVRCIEVLLVKWLATLIAYDSTASCSRFNFLANRNKVSPKTGTSARSGRSSPSADNWALGF